MESAVWVRTTSLTSMTKMRRQVTTGSKRIKLGATTKMKMHAMMTMATKMTWLNWGA